MPTTSKPRGGSLQFWPRKRAKRQYPKVRSWGKLDETKLMGFVGYKVGMTHSQVIEQNPNIKKPEVKFFPITILECPPLKPFSLRFYKKTSYGLRLISEILSKNLDKELARKIKLPKKTKEDKSDIREFDEVKLAVYTQPKLTSIGKKKPEIIELALSGKLEEKQKYCKEILNKDIKVEDVFKENQLIDVHAVTKGKGLQGPIKRFGIGLRSHKAEKGRRRAGNLGAWTPKKVSFRVPQAGQMGYQTRTEHNKLILKINNNTEEIIPKSGFHNYGLVKNTYLLIKGSIPGSKKRLVVLTEQLRTKKAFPIEIRSIKK